jgi:NAD(P)-dependent dehydrogenase (short-subunit alcohol dehydrogenase family)
VTDQLQLSLSQSQVFAMLSGDHNPLHLEQGYARRLQFGDSVVHGMHLVFLALESLVAINGQPGVVLRRIKVAFSRSVPHQQFFKIVTKLGDNGNFRLTVKVGDETAVRIRGELAQPDVDCDLSAPATLPVEESVAVVDWTGLSKRRGELKLGWDLSRAKKLFPILAEWPASGQLATLLATTRLVGNVCPGLHSIFNGFELEFPLAPAEPANNLGYEVSSLDERFNLVEMELRSRNCAGTVTATYRTSAAVQPNFSSVSHEIDIKLLEHRRVLIIGGSRGLGEVIAKVSAAHGASVTISYNRGQQDAESVASEISQDGRQCRAVRLDVTALEQGEIKQIIDSGPFDLVFYFATPQITMNPWVEWQPHVFDTYVRYYIHGFLSVAKLLLPNSKSMVLVQPSTAFADLPVPGCEEYVAAKVAMESAGSVLQSRFDGLTVIMPRLDRVFTDQTAMLGEASSKPALPVMMELLETCVAAMTRKPK